VNRVTIYQGHVLGVLRGMEDGSVHLVVTSPPYWGLRDYGLEPQIWGEALYSDGRPWPCKHEWRNQFCFTCGAWRGSLGLEPTIELYVEHLVEIFREVRRVLRKDGTLWLNMGDSYYGGGGAHKEHHANPGISKSASRNGVPASRGERSPGKALTFIDGPNRSYQAGLKPKDLCMIPARVALALQADGWWLRSQIIWSKPNPMPESVTDRPTTSHEYIWLLTKSAKYFYDAEAVREEVSGTAHPRQKKDGSPPSMDFKMQEAGSGNRNNPSFQSYMKDLPPERGRNLRSVWEIATAPFPEAHFATFPPAIPERCIKAGTSEKGCCPRCGVPWVRVVEKGKSTYAKIKEEQGISWSDMQAVAEDRGTALKAGNPACGSTRNKDGSAPHLEPAETTTLGWRPGCKCFDFSGCRFPPLKNGVVPDGAFMDLPEAIPVPCAVLDPFLGAGTTCLVAAKLGRDSKGIELSPDYVDMDCHRLKAELGMLVEIEVNKK